MSLLVGQFHRQKTAMPRVMRRLVRKVKHLATLELPEA